VIKLEFKCKFCSVVKKTKKSIENHMYYSHREEYLKLLSKKNVPKDSLIYAVGLDTEYESRFKITEEMKEKFKKKIEKLPGLDYFYYRLRKNLRRYDIYYLLCELFYRHINMGALHWKLEYLLGIISSIPLKEFLMQSIEDPVNFWKTIFYNLNALPFIIKKSEFKEVECEIERLADQKFFEFAIKYDYYPCQYDKTILRNYAFLGNKFPEKFGFSVDDLILFKNLIIDEICKRYVEVITKSNFIPVQEILKIFRFTLDKFKEFIPSDKFECFLHFLERLSFELGEENKEFKRPDDFNYIYRCPFIKIDEYYYLPLFRILPVVLMRTFYYDLINDETTRDEYLKEKGRMVENTLHKFLRKKILPEFIYKNPRYELKKGMEFENDIIVHYGNTFYIFECKNKKLTIPSIQGNVDSIREDIRRSIVDGMEQARRFIRDFKQVGELTLKTENQGEVTLKYEEECEFKIICITDENFGCLAVDLSYLNELVEDLNDEYPFATNLNDLEIILEEVDSKEYFFDYTVIKITKKFRLNCPDGMELFGFYLKNKEKLLNLEKKYFYVLTGFTDDLDRKYQGYSTTDLDTLAKCMEDRNLSFLKRIKKKK